MKHWLENLSPSRQGLGHFLVFVGACLVLLLADANAGQRPAATPAGSAIRSAQLLARDGRWGSVVPRSASEERAEIGAHFAAVQGILRQNTPSSLGIAVARYEQAFSLSLTPERKADLLGKLAARREVQLERLADYARAGRFPLNRHYAGEARPIFVDARGTHCAVGHLMAMDGWETEVIAIARAKPNVLVREVTDGPMVSWLLTSGLVQEEAALIQPFYTPPPTADTTMLSDLVVPGALLDRDGFRYQNFGFSASSTGGAATPIAAQFGVVYGWPAVATSPGVFCMGYGSAVCVQRQDALWFGFSPASHEDLSTAANQSISVAIDYDVVAFAAGLAVGGAQIFDNPNFGDLRGASLATVVNGDASGLLELQLTGFGGSTSALFDTPTSQVHVHHSIQLANGAAFKAFDSMILRPVPLPGSAGLLALAFAVVGRYFRQRSRLRWYLRAV